jgi:hypothetical protein
VPSSVSLAASPGGTWIARRVGARVAVLAAGGLAEVGALDLPTDDADLAFAGDQLVVVLRGALGELVLCGAGGAEVVARAEVDGGARLAAVTGSRLALVVGPHRSMVVARCQPRAVALAPAAGSELVDDVVGLDGDRLLVASAKKLEQWDAVAGRAVARMALPLPPPPRVLGAARGAVWAATAGGDRVWVFRLSDGRPFEHRLGAKLIGGADGAASAGVAGAGVGASHRESPHIVFATERGLVRLHVFTHETAPLPGADGRRTVALCQTVIDGAPALFAAAADGAVWRIGDEDAVSAPPAAVPAAAPVPVPVPAEGSEPIAAPAPFPAPVPAPSPVPTPAPPAAHQWRAELARWDGTGPPPPAPAPLIAEVQGAARRALVLLYGAWLRGTPEVPIARVAEVAGGDTGWDEALGTGELGRRGWIHIAGGRVALRHEVARQLDGAEP